jgi:hypothetical protein
MKDVITAFLSDKSARNSATLTALLVSVVNIGGPWSS